MTTVPDAARIVRRTGARPFAGPRAGALLAPLCASLLLLSARSSASAQPSDDLPGRIGVAAFLGTAAAGATTVECCELRTPPRLEPLEESPRLALAGGEVRLFWTPRSATFVQFERSGTDVRQFTFPRPLSDPFPFSFYEAERIVSYRSTTWTLGQTAELTIRGRVRPWIFAATAIRRTTEDQRETLLGFTDPSSRAVQNYEWRRRQWALVTGAGARGHLTRRLFVGGELGWVFYGRQACTDCAAAATAASLERNVPSYVTFRAAAGVVF